MVSQGGGSGVKEEGFVEKMLELSLKKSEQSLKLMRAQ